VPLGGAEQLKQAARCLRVSLGNPDRTTSAVGNGPIHGYNRGPRSPDRSSGAAKKESLVGNAPFECFSNPSGRERAAFGWLTDVRRGAVNDVIAPLADLPGSRACGWVRP